ncbi:MAG: hypothetical protein OXE50_14975 [Chloroflexi bacterium]|nr:hypothetical protein [Chloroflexota bacterium]
MQKPTGIDERLEQLRPPVIKSEGSTDSERYLAKIADRSFLNLWSYPNPYRDQKKSDKGNGKELCDLLVVCGAHIIIFSEKMIDWPCGSIDIAWRRWAKRAIRDSAKQTKGAERWISNFPERLYLDQDCSVPFPIDLPPEKDRHVHRVVIANGSAKACQAHAPSSSGSLIIRPSVLGESHWAGLEIDLKPFVIGDVDPDGSFVHVFNEASLDIVMAELDTITDFTNYLAKRASFIRSGQLIEANGEENLLAYYAVRINDDGDHDFVVETGNGPLFIDRQRYKRYISDPRYRAKKIADEVSYLWDRLIESFTTHMLDGTSITLDDHEFKLRENELGVRHMALVPRFIRRIHSEAIVGALQRGQHVDRFVRVMMSAAGTKQNETAFFIFTVKYVDWRKIKAGYENYRIMRSRTAQIYARGLLERYSHLKRVVGISREPPGQSHGVSEDLVYAEQCEWTKEDRKTIRKDCQLAGVLQDMKEHRYQGEEFPEVETVIIERPVRPQASSHLNRKQRRAHRARTRKRKR